MALKLNVIIGSTRPGRVGPSVARWIADVAAEHGAFKVELVDLADFGLPLLDEAAHPRLQAYANEPTRRWSQSVDSADAFLFVTPEYDFFPPAALVNAVQVLIKEWAYKPAGVVSYGGISGGLRAGQELRQLLVNVNVHPLPQAVPVPFVPQHLAEDGAFRATPPMQDGARLLLDELHKWAVALKTLRPGSAEEPTRQDKAA
ncbi:NADPH-dependent FMN reductase [Rubellimicrobium mesophilum DSM 19309]|uniref:NADPH-dependent FMN reductase n=1 Tax=Rubellimicrobium mesophilum DSM 19309 TaxID=442562 RepID=A0A017HV86_9RHOB|nr:NAD(P)H-dependent oxidoreductase [Rubellimicrobium mesophilum]EYD78245.1 NADPH-dependent FMN reductase [Rubellimicrobium mesophilum DSM 19309]